MTVQDLFTLDAAVTANDPDFWSFALMAAYQGTITKSRDPDSDPATLSVVGTIGGSAAVVFLETIADLGEGAILNESSTLAHELGHLLCLHHGEGGLMGSGADGRVSDIVSIRDRSEEFAEPFAGMDPVSRI